MAPAPLRADTRSLPARERQRKCQTAVGSIAAPYRASPRFHNRSAASCASKPYREGISLQPSPRLRFCMQFFARETCHVQPTSIPVAPARASLAYHSHRADDSVGRRRARSGRHRSAGCGRVPSITEGQPPDGSCRAVAFALTFHHIVSYNGSQLTLVTPRATRARSSSAGWGSQLRPRCVDRRSRARRLRASMGCAGGGRNTAAWYSAVQRWPGKQDHQFLIRR